MEAHHSLEGVAFLVNWEFPRLVSLL
jgi:hypothetical protein